MLITFFVAAMSKTTKFSLQPFKDRLILQRQRQNTPLTRTIYILIWPETRSRYLCYTRGEGPFGAPAEEKKNFHIDASHRVQKCITKGRATSVRYDVGRRGKAGPREGRRTSLPYKQKNRRCLVKGLGTARRSL